MNLIWGNFSSFLCCVFLLSEIMWNLYVTLKSNAFVLFFLLVVMLRWNGLTDESYTKEHWHINLYIRSFSCRLRAVYNKCLPLSQRISNIQNIKIKMCRFIVYFMISLFSLLSRHLHITIKKEKKPMTFVLFVVCCRYEVLLWDILNIKCNFRITIHFFQQIQRNLKSPPNLWTKRTWNIYKYNCSLKITMNNNVQRSFTVYFFPHLSNGQ